MNKYEKALIRLTRPYMAKDVQNIYHDCNDCNGEEYLIDEDVNLLFLLIDDYTKIIKENEQLNNSLDKACDLLEKSKAGTTCDEENRKNCMENHCFNTCIYARKMNKEEWKKYLMEK